MYNRYVPQPDGSFHRNRMQDNTQASVQSRNEEFKAPYSPPPEIQVKTPVSQQGLSITGFIKQLLPKGLDTGDLLIILLLLLMAGDCQEEQNTALLTLVLYLFM